MTQSCWTPFWAGRFIPFLSDLSQALFCFYSWAPMSLWVFPLGIHGPFANSFGFSHFSNSYFAHGMLFLSFLASLSPLAFSRPMYTFVGPVTHHSCRLGLMVFFTIYTVNSLWPSSLGFSIYWASTNGPQHIENHFYISLPEKFSKLASFMDFYMSVTTFCSCQSCCLN